MLFLDACTVIYHVEAVQPFLGRLRKAIEAFGEELVAVSRLSRLECLVKPVREGNEAVIERYEHFFSTDMLTIVELTPEVIDRALGLRARLGLRTADALQAASALTLNVPSRFLTNDKVFKKVPGLDVHLI